MIIGLTPVYNGEDILPEFFEHMDMLDPKVDYHIFVTNNCTDKTNELIDERIEPIRSEDAFEVAILNERYATARQHYGRGGERISWNYPKDFVKQMDNPYANLAIARHVGIQRAIETMRANSPYKFLYMSDDDTWPLESDALQVAMDWLDDPTVDIIGGSYLRYFPENPTTPMLASRWAEKPHLRAEIRGPLMRPIATSGGFMVIPRGVLMDERLTWWPMFKWPELNIGDDFAYCLQAGSLGYLIALDGMIQLEHKSRERTRSWEATIDGEYVPFEFEVGPE